MLQWHTCTPAVGLHDTRHTTHDTRHMITYEWKIEWHDRADLVSGDIVDIDHYDTLSEMLAAVERSKELCQVCLVRDDEDGPRSHLYFTERNTFDEDGCEAPQRYARQILSARNKARIAALMAAGRILRDDQIGGAA